MARYAFTKLISLIPVSFGVVVLVSLMIHLVPGDPVDQLLGDYATATEKNKLRQQLKLDQPIHQRIITYFSQLAAGDLGDSLIYQRPISNMIRERALPTLELAILSVLFALCLSLPLGIIAALKKGTWADTGARGLSLFAMAVPNFILGPLLILLFALEWNFLPVSGRQSWLTYILPILTLGSSLAAILSRMTRAAFIDELKCDYVRTGKAKGLGPLPLLGKHVLKNASLPITTLVGLQFGALLTGSVVTEKIFDWPGLGSLMIEALSQRDYPLIQACVLVFSMTYLFVNLSTDIIYSWLDPRIRWDQKT